MNSLVPATLWTPKEKTYQSSEKEPQNNEMQGTPQAYLSFVMPGRTVASMDVKKCLTGAPDLNAVLRQTCLG